MPGVMRSLIGRVALAVSLALSAPAAADAAEDLAGWWIGIDQLFPAFWAMGYITPTEELLVVDADGAVENRLMLFYGAITDACHEHGGCSDVPLAATARLEISGDRIAFLDTVRTDDRVQFSHPEHDAAFRDLLLTGTPEWGYALESDGDLLELRRRGDPILRRFARIDPHDLGRLRYAFLELAQSASDHWRCFFGNAMAGDPAFADLEGDPTAMPADFEAFVNAAAYMGALMQALVLPVSAGPELEDDAALPPVELLLMPALPGIEMPTTTEERHALIDRHRPLLQAMNGSERADGLPLSEDELTAYLSARALPPPYRALLCR